MLAACYTLLLTRLIRGDFDNISVTKREYTMTKQEFFRTNRAQAVSHATKYFSFYHMDLSNFDEKIAEMSMACLESWYDDWLMSRD
jgi:hypothetical protein